MANSLVNKIAPATDNLQMSVTGAISMLQVL